MTDPGSSNRNAASSSLDEWLAQAQQQGFLGPKPVAEQRAHSLGLASALSGAPVSALDLGAGGGVPGLVLAVTAWPETNWALLEASSRRSAFLAAAVAAFGIGDRVRVVAERAETAGRSDGLRAQFGLVISRSFASPGVTAECGAPFLMEGGRLLVSEPPGVGAARWPAAGLAVLGLSLERRVQHPVRAVVLRAVAPCDDRYPRRVGVPTKRPLF